jgi:hypothetical protein
MPAPESETRSWPWTQSGSPAPAPDSGEDRAALARACVRLFTHDDGRRLLAHLRAQTIGRHLGPEASDAALRHLEGQRALVAHLERLIAEGWTPG